MLFSSFPDNSKGKLQVVAIPFYLIFLFLLLMNKLVYYVWIHLWKNFRRLFSLSNLIAQLDQIAAQVFLSLLLGYSVRRLVKGSD